MEEEILQQRPRIYYFLFNVTNKIIETEQQIVLRMPSTSKFDKK